MDVSKRDAIRLKDLYYEAEKYKKSVCNGGYCHLCPEHYLGTEDNLCCAIESYMLTHGVNFDKHAYWYLIDAASNEGVYCSNCRKKVYNTQYYANVKQKSNRCPNCGAIMDLEEEPQGYYKLGRE